MSAQEESISLNRGLKVGKKTEHKRGKEMIMMESFSNSSRH